MQADIQDLGSQALLSIGGSSITIARLISALVVVAIAFFAARLTGVVLRRMRTKAHSGRSAIYILEKLSTYGLVIVGLFIGMSTLGIDLSSLAVFAGAVGVGVGLGLQGVVREFVSGLFLIFDPLIHVGDFVELDDVRGEIIEVGPRATRIRTNDNLDVVIPNSKLIENRVTNWTLKGSTRRIHVPFGAAYGSDKDTVRDAVVKAVNALPFTLPEEDGRKTQVWLTGFGDSALNFELVVWPTPEAVRRPAAMNAAYAWAIDDALKAAGIEIPFPQVDLRIRSLFGREGNPALAAAGLSVEAAEAAERPAEQTESPHPSSNDAMEHLVREAERERVKAELNDRPVAADPAAPAPPVVEDEPSGPRT